MYFTHFYLIWKNLSTDKKLISTYIRSTHRDKPFIKRKYLPGMVVHASNSGTQNTKTVSRMEKGIKKA
jgi:hypothetical protein